MLKFMCGKITRFDPNFDFSGILGFGCRGSQFGFIDDGSLFAKVFGKRCLIIDFEVPLMRGKEIENLRGVPQPPPMAVRPVA